MVGETETSSAIGQPYGQWVEQIKRFDHDAWDDLLKLFADDLRHDITISLRKRDLPDELAEDIEQETWLTAVRGMGDFVWESEDKFYHWLRVISLNHIRSYRRHSAQVVSLDDFTTHQPNDDLDHFQMAWGAVDAPLDEQLILREKMSALDRALRTLKPQEREILMRWLMGEPRRELALAYRMKPESLSMLLMRAKEKVEANVLYLQSLGTKERHDD